MSVKVLRRGSLFSAALLLSVAAGACQGGPPGMQGGPPPMPVELQTVQASTVVETSEFVGALEAEDRVVLRPEADGRVVEIFVRPGDVVQARTPIVQLRADRSRAEVSGAIADLEAAQSSRNTAIARLRAAEADVARAAADVTLAESDYRRIESLVSAGALSRQELDRARNNRDTAIASRRAAEENVRAAEASLRETESQIARAQADRNVAVEDLQDRQVISPIAGVVGNIPVKVGDLVTPSTTLTSIIQNGTLDLNIAVPIERSRQLRVGLPVEMLDEQGQPALRGRISFVSPEVSSGEQSVLAKASFTNDGSLRDGQLVRTRVVWSSQPGLLVPTAAVTRIAGQTFVYVAEQAEANPDQPAPANGAPGQPPMQVARQRLVQLGSIQGNSYQVISGVQPGEQVVVSGVLNLTEGAPIMPAQAMAQ
ncbi:efflux RND transporter periplasmic adaptor subunit [Thermoleptolyngbya sp. C42_A2020_037]|uniref:efflux RND transporter periplasmic adaptor subunit n=1 Tax=Thermoleptolyngbya sp. C42_A2020_037 TaxID=2747799 RepID=UPI0025E283C8|nr:efflux RND transporter periplasmic adaptor subunit [Thermoleptolyngbya sp. C42_A2020_037]